MNDALALRALAAIIADDQLRTRFLALTGYDGATLRARVGEADMCIAIGDFLTSHEPDLLRIAAVLGVKPEALCP